ncbi:MAG: phytoene/squalene synthase family protein, partial [Pseudoxanthomonas sp.]
GPLLRDQTMTDSTALDSFLDKWLARWPEWRVVETFVPASQRRLALAWFALQQEFTDAMNIVGDPLPADAKLAWWGEELRDWSRLRSRHPLGRVLEPHRAPWFELAEALPALIGLRERQPDAPSAFDAVHPLAVAIASVEHALFPTPVDDLAVQALCAQLLATRLEAAGEAAVPRRVGGADAPTRNDWVDELLQRWPSRGTGPLPRRLASALARSQMQRAGGVGETIATLSPPRALWLGWRAARQR